MSPSPNEARWRELEPYIDAIKASIENPSAYFFDRTYADFPDWFVILLTKLRRFTSADDFVFLTCAADKDGAPTNRLLALTSQHVISSTSSEDDDQPLVEAWSRHNLYQVSVEHMAPHALPTEPARGFHDRPLELVVQLRYSGREPITVPYEGGSPTCVQQLDSVLPVLTENIAAIPIALR